MEKPNHEKINYSIRPGKHVERRMLCDAFTRLSSLDNLKNYQYIGFGSVYFTDFSLIHKVLGITDLTSIERDRENTRRFKFNIPYSCIKLKIGPSTEELQKIKWVKKSIVWLDYTEKLKNYMLDDIQTCLMSMKAGSIFLMSVNIEPDNGNLSEKEKKEGLTVGMKRLKLLEDRIDRRFIPSKASSSLLGLIDNQSFAYEIIDNAIRGTLTKRNGVLKPDEQLQFMQLFNFYYKDGAGMLTIGGIIHTKSQVPIIKVMGFDKIPYIRQNDQPFKIVIPNLTYREIHALDNLLPALYKKQTEEIVITKKNKVFIPPIPEEDIKDYANIYRYFPNFVEANLS